MSSESGERWGFAVVSAAILVALGFIVFRLGDRASASVELSDPHVWVEHASDGELLQINGTTGDITARVDVAQPGDDYVAMPHGDGAVVLNRSSATLRFIDLVELAGGRSISIDIADLDASDLEILGGFDPNSKAWVVGDDRLINVDPTTEEVSTVVVSGGIGQTVRTSSGRIFVLEPGQVIVNVLDRDGLAEWSELTDPVVDGQFPRRLVPVGDSLYLVDPERLAVNEMGEGGSLGLPSCLTSGSTGTLMAGSHLTPDGLTRRIVVHDPERGVLSVSEPDTGACFDIDVTSPNSFFGPPVVVDDTAYLPNYDRGRIELVDLARRRRGDNLPFASVQGRAFELEVFENVVWANEPLGPFAAIVSPAGIVPIAKADTLVTTGVVAEDGEGDGGTGSSPQQSSGLFAIGSTGAEVAAAGGATGTIGDLPGGDGAVEDSALDDTSSDEIESDVLGVALDASGVDASASQNLTASFRVSTLTPAVEQVVQFTDLSTGVPVSWTWNFGDGTSANGPDVTKSWSSEGVFPVELVIVDALGREATATVDVAVLAATVSLPPVADFVFDKTTVEPGEAIEFESRSTGDYDELSWDFGDGAAATGELVSHQYEAVGEYTITLTALGEAGSSTASTIITVVPGIVAPRAVIAALPGTVETGQFVTIRSASLNDPTTTSWDFGDGTRGSGARVQHAWQSPGTYRIRLRVANGAGEDTTFAEIRVERAVDPPRARFGQSGLEAITGEVLRFTDLSRNEPTSVTWTFGDGASASGSEVTHSWTQPGRYRVTIEVSNKAGSDRRSKTVTIREPVFAPDASFTASDTTVMIGAPVQFVDTSTNEPTEWWWDFGDGSTGSTRDVTHSFARPGTFSVRLFASNVGGSDSFERVIEVISPPAASFETEIDELVVQFFDTSTNNPESWSWDFGDDRGSDEQNPRHRYRSAGTYDVTLVVGNDFGISTMTGTVTVARPPEADFGRSIAGLTVTFTDRSEYATSWNWDFGDGSTSDEQNPVHTYDDAGEYEVTLTVFNVAGSDDRTKTFSVSFPAVIARIDCERDRFVIICNGERSQNAVEYSWSADDAIVISGRDEPEAIFIFPRSGRFDITLEVTGAQGQTDSRTVRSPRVDGADVPEVTRVNVRSNSDGVVELRGFADNFPQNWGWDVEGATVIAGAGTDRPTLQFDSNGNFDGTVWAENELGRSDAFSFVISINDLDRPEDDD